MTTINLDFPTDVVSALRRSPQEFARDLRIAAAVHWYARGEVSHERAAQIAGMTRAQFVDELARQKVPAFAIDMDELERELDRG